MFLRDLWIATRRNYFGSLQRRGLSGTQSNSQHPIDVEIKESLSQAENFLWGKRGLIRCLVGGNQRRDGGEFNLFQALGRSALVRKC